MTCILDVDIETKIQKLHVIYGNGSKVLTFNESYSSLKIPQESQTTE